MLRNAKTDFLQCIGYLSVTKDRIDNPYFEGMVNQIYPPELRLNKANTSDTEAPFLNLHLSTCISSKIYDKRDDFDFDTVNFPFYGVYISQLIGFATVSSHVADFNAHNKNLTAKLLNRAIVLFAKVFLIKSQQRREEKQNISSGYQGWGCIL